MDDLNSRLTLNEEIVINFTKQLYTLLRAGIPLYKAIQIIQLQTNSFSFKKVLNTLKENLAEGKPLSEALSSFPKIFSSFYISMTRSGERHGQLDETLARIYEYQEKLRENRQKLINSLTYPLLLLTIGSIVLLLMIIFVLPKFIDIFTQANLPLPLPTKILFQITTFLQHRYPWLLFICGGFVAGYFIVEKYPDSKYIIDKYKLGLPLLGNVLLNLYIARFSRTFGILHQSGIQLLEALELSKPSLTNKVLEYEIDKLIKNIQNGQGLAQPLSESKIFPPMMVQMVAVGEETGALDKMLLDIADYFELETDLRTKKILSLIEPCALLGIAILVAFIASAIMLPLFKMTGMLHVS
jgi:type II secretory pathway component PulF